MEAMTEPGSASKYNKLFPEKGQRVQRHKRSYSAAGGAPSLLGAGMRSRRGGERADAKATKCCTSH